MKKIIDEHGRVFGKVSIIDFFVILIAIVLLGAIYLKFNVLDATSVSTDTQTISYTVTIAGARHYTVEAIQPGDLLFDKTGSGGYSIGKITDIAVTDAKKASATLDGTIVMGNYVGYYDIILTVEAETTLSAGRYLVNKTYELNANSQRNLYTKYCTFQAKITGLQ